MSNKSVLHKEMSTITKRIIFFSLMLLFITYSILIAGTVTNSTKGAEALSEEAKSGKLLFQKYNCIACHQVYGLGGYMGPDLTNVASATNKGTAFIKGLLKYGTNRMPDFHLNKNEINALTAYLNYIDKTGLSPVKEFTVNPDGTYTATNEK